MYSKPLIFQLFFEQPLYVIPIPIHKYFLLCFQNKVFRTYSFDPLIFEKVLNYNAKDWEIAITEFTFIELAKY